VRWLEHQMFEGGGGGDERGLGSHSMMGTSSMSISSTVGWTDAWTSPFVFVWGMDEMGGGGFCALLPTNLPSSGWSSLYSTASLSDPSACPSSHTVRWAKVSASPVFFFGWMSSSQGSMTASGLSSKRFSMTLRQAIFSCQAWLNVSYESVV